MECYTAYKCIIVKLMGYYQLNYTGFQNTRIDKHTTLSHAGTPPGAYPLQYRGRTKHNVIVLFLAFELTTFEL